MTNTTIKLSELQDLIRGTLETAFQGRSWWLLAELEDITDQGSRIFLTFIEKGSNNAPAARIGGAVLHPEALALFRNFEDITGKRVQGLAGQQVLVRITVTVHSTMGLRLNVLDIDHRFMLGQLEQQREQTFKRLAAKLNMRPVNGRWLTPNKALVLPAVIQRIAVITSASAAGFEDFAHKLRTDANQYGFAVIGFFAQVQGEGAAEAMREQLLKVFEQHSAGNRFDAVVFIRGGGAQSDLLPFDAFTLAFPIAKFPIPVITGIGHQKNESIADQMAHTALKTPTEAAQFIINHNRRFEEALETTYSHLVHRSHELLARHRFELEKRSAELASGVRLLLGEQTNQLTRTSAVITSGARNLLRNSANDLRQLRQQLTTGTLVLTRNASNTLREMNNQLRRSTNHFAERKNHELVLLTERVRLLHPEHVLRRGYTYVTRNEQVITSASQLETDQTVTVHFHDGSTKATLNTLTLHERDVDV